MKFLTKLNSLTTGKNTMCIPPQLSSKSEKLLFKIWNSTKLETINQDFTVNNIAYEL
jgi:hypothetical protein